MTLESISHFGSTLVAHLGDSAIRSIGLALAAGLITMAVRLRPARLRLLTWTGVLYAAMMMPLLGVALPAIKLPVLPALGKATSASHLMAEGDRQDCEGIGPVINAAPGDAQEVARARGNAASPGAIVINELLFAGPTIPQTQAAEPSAAFSGQRSWWLALPVVIYLAVAMILLARVMTGVLLGRRLRRQASRITDQEVAMLSGQIHAGRPGSSRVMVAESPSVSVPLTVGAFRPAVLLPRCWRSWDRKKLFAVLAHEFSHVERRDALTQLLSAVHRSVFWFSPLPWWLHRRLIDLAEQASDDAAVLAVQDPAAYAEVLLGFFQSLNAAPARWLGVSMARGDRAGRRIDRILHGALPPAARLSRKTVVRCVVIGIALTVPAATVRIVRASGASEQKTTAAGQVSKDRTSVAAVSISSSSNQPEARSAPGDEAGARSEVVDDRSGGQGSSKSATPTDNSLGQQTPPASPDGVPQSAAPAPAVAAPVVQLQAAPGAAVPPAIAALAPPVSVGPVAAFASVIPAAPVMAMPPARRQNESAWVFGNLAGGDTYVIVSKDGTIWMIGAWNDGDEAKLKSLRKKIKTDFIWFKRDGRSYIITDPATVKAARELFASQADLGRLQAELAAELAQLAEKRRDLSKQMAALGAQMPDLTAEIAKITEQFRALNLESKQSELGAAMAELRAKLAEIQSQASNEGLKFDEMRSELARRQSELSRQRTQLVQEHVLRANDTKNKLRSLVDRALSDGLAKPEP